MKKILTYFIFLLSVLSCSKKIEHQDSVPGAITFAVPEVAETKSILIEDADDLVISVGDTCELSIKKVLLCSQHLKVVCTTALHKKFCIPNCCLEMYNLLFIEIIAFFCSFPF